MIHVIVPPHLRAHAQISGEILLDVESPVTQRRLLDALETRYPQLEGMIREHVTHQRRPLLRFFACGKDLSHDSPDTTLPDSVVKGDESFWIVGAIAGG